MTTSEWFPGEGRDEHDEAFLGELRACAENRGLVDATPGDTCVHIWDDDVLVLLVTVPRLQEGPVRPMLEVISQSRSRDTGVKQISVDLGLSSEGGRHP